MTIALFILLAPLALCLFLLGSCAVQRARTARLPSLWRNVAVFSVLGALIYTPVVVMFLHEAGHLNG